MMQRFQKKLLGEGVAIIPKDGKVYAPFDGTVTSLFPTKHAIGLTSDEGVELLIHFGLETVELKGRGFVSHVSDGEKVEKGQLMLEVDVEMLVAEGYDIVTPVVVTNTQEYLDVLLLSTKEEVNYADDLLAVL